MDHTIIFQPSGRRARVSEGTTILDAARKLGVGIEAVCGENLVCGKCRVKIMEGEFPKEDITSSLSHVGKVDEKEMKTLKKKEKKENIRLACSTSIMGDVLVFVPEATRTGKQIVSKAAGKIKVKIKPAVKKYYVELPPPSLEDPYGDHERGLRCPCQSSRAKESFHRLQGASSLAGCPQNRGLEGNGNGVAEP